MRKRERTMLAHKLLHAASVLKDDRLSWPQPMWNKRKRIRMARKLIRYSAELLSP